MNLRELEYLVALAEQQNFGRAAEACGVTQSTLSTQVRKLERELGVELVERGTQRAELTDIGERIVERARIVLYETNTIINLARNSADPTSARLRLGLFPTLGPYLLPQIMPKIRSTYPELELILVEEKTDEILEQLGTGALDAAVLAMPIDDRGLDHVPLFDEDFLLAVPSGHSLAGRDHVSLEALAGEEILLLEDGHCLRDHALDVCELAGAVEREDFRSTSLETMRQMVASGLGITLLPSLAVQPTASSHDSIELVAFSDPVPSRRVILCWRSSSAYRDFFPQLAELFRQLPQGAVDPIS